MRACEIRRGTTPVVEVRLDEDVGGCECRVAFAGGGRTVVKGPGEYELSGDGRTLYVPLSQEDTLAFAAGGLVRVQVRYRDAGGDVHATDIARAVVGEALDEEVM